VLNSKNIELKAFEQSQDKRKLKKTLTELHRQQERLQQNKKIKPLEKLKIPIRSIINIQDINFNLIKDTQQEQKIARN
jgi:hypothetical protein